MLWLIGEVDVRISGSKRVCTEKTMCKTSEVPREGKAKGVNENSSERVIPPQIASLRQHMRSSWRHLDLVAVQNTPVSRSAKDLRMGSRRKQMRSKPQKMRVVNNLLFLAQDETGCWARNQRSNAYYEGTGWTQHSTPMWWTPLVVELCRGKMREVREAPPHGASAPAALTNQMTPMTYASIFPAISHRLSTFSQLDVQMTD